MKRLSLLLCCAAVCAFVGCGDDSPTEAESQERAKALFAQAAAAADNGDAQEAARLYREVLGLDGDNASAHLSLALIEDDAQGDYLEAVHHYQAYLALQPTAESRAMVEERLAAARGKLADQLAALARMREEIVWEIDRVEEPQLRRLLKLRYLQGMTWERVAVTMNYSFRQVTRMHGEALNHILREKMS